MVLYMGIVELEPKGCYKDLIPPTVCHARHTARCVPLGDKCSPAFLPKSMEIAEDSAKIGY